jgi:hypothetical protein
MRNGQCRRAANRTRFPRSVLNQRTRQLVNVMSVRQCTSAYHPRIRTIALVDHTREYPPSPGVLEAIAEALTIQVRRDLAPAWGVTDAEFAVRGRGDKIHFFDSAEEASDYGWHIVDDDGDPYAHVFAAPSVEHGSDWIKGADPISVTASHEALEMFTDPRANEFCFDGKKHLWAREVCDPVQARSYKIVAGRMRVPVSNFVLPAYFNPWAPGPYDHLGVLKQPFTLDKGATRWSKERAKNKSGTAAVSTPSSTTPCPHGSAARSSKDGVARFGASR